jgi:hypothetical protein
MFNLKSMGLCCSGQCAAVPAWSPQSLAPFGVSKTDADRRGAMLERANENKGNQMADVTIVYWRDMPAQVIVGKGRRGTKRPLPERFEQAIDRAAMKSGAAESDAYLEGFRKAAPYPVEGDDAEVASAEVARIDAEFDAERLKALITNDGWA